MTEHARHEVKYELVRTAIMGNPPPPLASLTTVLYRQSLSNFLFYTDASLEHPSDGHLNSITLWIGDTARSLTLRAATPVADESTSSTIANAQRNKAKESQKNSNMLNAKSTASDVVRALSSHCYDFVCTACGTFLFPPRTSTIITDGSESLALSINEKIDIQQLSRKPLPSNIYIRPLKRGRTRRRRASRAKAKQLHNHAISLQRRGASNTSIQLRKDTLIKEDMQRIASSFCMGDGRAKNCLVMSCTFCGTKRKRKGAAVKKKPKNGGGEAVSRAEQKQSEIKVESIASQIRDNSDFISLGPFGDAWKSPVKQQQPHGNQVQSGKKKSYEDAGAFASPLNSGKKKKRRKKSETKKGHLMDFLSSLND